MTQTGHKSVKVFCSYSHKDERYLTKLKAHLAGLTREGLIEEWHDRKILPGQEWEEAIAENLTTAHIIILLVTPDFMGSDFVNEKELTQALARHEQGEACVVPVIVRPSDWEWAPFGKLQALPKDARPITEWSNRDKAWLNVARGIREAVRERLYERELSAKERYHEAVAEAWADKKLDEAEVERLQTLAAELGLGADTAADIGREAMGDTVEAILARQTRDREEEERSERLDELYGQVRRAHHAQEWQAVVDLFDEIRAVDPECSDSEGLLASAREELVSQDPPTGDTDSPSTSPWEYVDLELEIREGDRSKYPVVVRSAKGVEVREEMHFPFDERELEDKLDDLEKAVLLSGTTRRSIRSPERQIVQDFGQALFQALLGGQVGACYDETLRKAKRQNKGLRLKLRIQPPELATLPWEFLYDPDRNAYLSLSSKTPLVRYVDVPRPVEQLPVTPPLRILGMIASPHDLPRLEVEKEKRRVKEAIGDLEARGRVELTWLEGQTSRALLRAMRRGPWHVFHFIGHGGFFPEREEGLIALADEEGNARFLRADNLAELLKDHWDLRLVLLNSCEGARARKHHSFSSTAAALVRPGIPAVLANQYEISDEAAVEFSRAFYEAVADGLPLDAATAGARTSVKVEIDNSLEWGTPVLYLQSPDGRVFDVQRDDRKEEEGGEEDSLSRYRECVESAWADEELHEREVDWLSDYAHNKLRLDPSTAAGIEREVMGDPKEVVFERQTRDREEEESRNRRNELYARARRAHRAQEWQAVVDLFDQIRSEDPAHPDPEDLLVSARTALEALEQTRGVATMYDQGLLHMSAREWSQAVECFEEVQRLEPGYRQIEELLSQVRREGRPRFLPGNHRAKPNSLPGKPKAKPGFLPAEEDPKHGRPPSLPE
jgi:hypothetical protein